MEFMFVCSAGHSRSPTAARIAAELAREKGIKRFSSQYFGIDVEHFHSDEDIARRFERVDRFFVMDLDMKGKLMRRYNVSEEKIENLDIEDNYTRESLMLKEILEEKLKPYFEGLGRS